MKKYGKISTDEHGFFEMSMSQHLSLWESYDDDEFTPTHIVVDTAGSPRVEHKDIPKVIEFLSAVYKERVTEKAKLKRAADTIWNCPLAGENDK